MSHFPFVSVIIPVYNDPFGIRDTLSSLFRQNYPENKHEIIVVDNHSRDDTVSMIRQTAARFKRDIIIETEKTQSSYAARNKGARVARGDIIAFIDSNMTVQPDWIDKGATCFKNKKAEYVGCGIRVYASKKKPSLWEKYDIALGFPVKNYMETDGYAPTACLFVAKRVMEEIGLFDSRLLSGGDVEFGVRARDHGVKMYFDHENVMCHPARDSFSSLFEKQKRVTLGQIRLRRLFPERFKKNGIRDIATCFLQCFPVASLGVFLKLSASRADFFSLFIGFYSLRLYTNYLKVIHKTLF